MSKNLAIVKVTGAADGTATPHDGRYVVSWDWNVKAGTLALTSTDDINKARVFEDGAEFEEWKSVSKVQARRPWDGKPNRPLTAVSIERITANSEGRKTNGRK